MCKKAGYWQTLFTGDNTTGYFDFSAIDFSRISFSSDVSPRTINKRIVTKKVDKMEVRFENDSLNTPFGLETIAVEYVEGSNYKGW